MTLHVAYFCISNMRSCIKRMNCSPINITRDGHQNWNQNVIVTIFFTMYVVNGEIKCCRQKDNFLRNQLQKTNHHPCDIRRPLCDCHRPLDRYVNCWLRMHRECCELLFRHGRLAIPTCVTARAWRTCRDACWDRWLAVAGKCSRHSRRMPNPQFYVSGKSPMGLLYSRLSLQRGQYDMLSLASLQWLNPNTNEIEPTKETPDLVLTAELWGVFCEGGFLGKIDRVITQSIQCYVHSFIVWKFLWLWIMPLSAIVQ